MREMCDPEYARFIAESGGADIQIWTREKCKMEREKGQKSGALQRVVSAVGGVVCVLLGLLKESV